MVESKDFVDTNSLTHTMPSMFGPPAVVLKGQSDALSPLFIALEQ